jgi:hypothetical protein
MPRLKRSISVGCNLRCEGWSPRRLLSEWPVSYYSSAQTCSTLSVAHLCIGECDADFPPIWNIVLGLNDASSARKLVRLLLADPLTPRENWEDILDSYDADSSRGLLIRYGRVFRLQLFEVVLT